MDWGGNNMNNEKLKIIKRDAKVEYLIYKFNIKFFWALFGIVTLCQLILNFCFHYAKFWSLATIIELLIVFFLPKLLDQASYLDDDTKADMKAFDEISAEQYRKIDIQNSVIWWYVYFNWAMGAVLPLFAMKYEVLRAIPELFLIMNLLASSVLLISFVISSLMISNKN